MAGRKRRLLSVAAGSWHSENVDENTKLTDILHWLIGGLADYINLYSPTGDGIGKTMLRRITHKMTRIFWDIATEIVTVCV